MVKREEGREMFTDQKQLAMCILWKDRALIVFLVVWASRPLFARLVTASDEINNEIIEILRTLPMAILATMTLGGVKKIGGQTLGRS